MLVQVYFYIKQKFIPALVPFFQIEVKLIKSFMSYCVMFLKRKFGKFDNALQPCLSICIHYRRNVHDLILIQMTCFFFDK